MHDYRNTPEFKEFLERRERNKCKECGGTSHMLQPHKKTCSKYKHLIDDHYDSPCMRGTCTECFPDYKPKRYIEVSEEEYEIIQNLRNNK